MGSSRTTRRGFTLLELIVVTALLAAIGGLVMPSLLGRLGGATLEAVSVRLEAGAALCRAEAQRRGGSLALVARADGAVVWRAQDGEDRPVDEVLFDLPAGYRIAETASGAGGDGPGGVTVVAVFRPDGTAAAPGESFLRAPGTVLAIRVARWTGGVSLGPVAEEESGLPGKGARFSSDGNEDGGGS